MWSSSQYPCRELNPGLSLRRATLYPLSYRGIQGGEAGIRTLGGAIRPLNHLAGGSDQPLRHLPKGHSASCRMHDMFKYKAEGVGFEPTVTCATTVFKTVAFGHSATPPGRAIPRAQSILVPQRN